MKENKLFEASLSRRSIISESRYKTYKHKLTTIIRSAKNSILTVFSRRKIYYIAGAWNILKQVMGTLHAGNYYPDHLENNGVTASNKNDIGNMFNNLFTNIGSILSTYIIVAANVTIYDYVKHMNNHNLFLTPVIEEDVIGVVR